MTEKKAVNTAKTTETTAIGSVYRLSSYEATRLAMPHYNGFACGHGPHGDVKYNRAREKRRFATWD